MPDLSTLFSGMAMPEPEQPQDPQASAIMEALQAIQARKEALTSREDQVLERMGLNTVERRKKDLIEADKPKGFWKNLGKIGEEVLRGVGGDAPYSDRMDQRARQQMALESPIDAQILTSTSSQQNRLSQDEARLAQAAENMGLKLEDLGIKREGNVIRRIAADATASRAKTAQGELERKQTLTPFDIALKTAQAGKATSGSALDFAKAGKTTQETSDLVKRMGLTGKDANQNVMSDMPGDRVDKIFGLKKREADIEAAKTLGGKYPPGSSAGAIANARKIVGNVVDEATGLPALQDKEGKFYASDGNPEPVWVPKVTGENSGAASRAASGYKQVDQIFPIIEKVAPKMGLIRGTFEDWMNTAKVNPDPDIKLLYGYLDSISKFAAGIHGMRSREAAKDIFNAMKNMRTNPEAFKASIIAVKKAFGERGLAIPGASTFFRAEGMNMDDVRSFVEAQGMDALNVKPTPMAPYKRPIGQGQNKVNGMPVPAAPSGAASAPGPGEISGQSALDLIRSRKKK